MQDIRCSDGLIGRQILSSLDLLDNALVLGDQADGYNVGGSTFLAFTSWRRARRWIQCWGFLLRRVHVFVGRHEVKKRVSESYRK